MATHEKPNQAHDHPQSSEKSSQPPLQIAVYISGHGYGHYTRTENLLSLLSKTGKYNFHIRTTSPLFPDYLKYPIHSSVIQFNPYELDDEKSLQSLQDFDPSIAEQEETKFLKDQHIRAIISDAPSLPCLIAHSLKIPSILVTNFTFDSIYQALLDNAPQHPDKTALQQKIDEMAGHYALAHTVIRLPGYVPFLFKGPKIVDAAMHFRKAQLSKTETLSGLGLPPLEDEKILLHCFGGHNLDAPTSLPELPEGWVCISQTISSPPHFYKIGQGVYMPDLIAASDAVLGKLGWGTCSEAIGNGYKPFIYVPRSAFIEDAGLQKWMEKAHRRVVRLDVERYESTDWKGAIEEAEQLGAQKLGFEEDWGKNEEELVNIFEETIKSALS